MKLLPLVLMTFVFAFGCAVMAALAIFAAALS